MLPPSHSPQPGIPSKTASAGSQAGRAELFRKVFKLVRPGAPVPSFQVDFYPFTGVRHIIHLNDNGVQVRLSDILKGAPPLVFEALAEILICRVYGHASSREVHDLQTMFRSLRIITASSCPARVIVINRAASRTDARGRERGTKKMVSPRGEVHNLQTMFRSLNRRYLGGQRGGIARSKKLSSARKKLIARKAQGPPAGGEDRLEPAAFSKRAGTFRPRAPRDRHQPQTRPPAGSSLRPGIPHLL